MSWAVTAVTTHVPWTPSAANVARSAAIPAAPPESVPATVSTTGGFTRSALASSVGDDARRVVRPRITAPITATPFAPAATAAAALPA